MIDYDWVAIGSGEVVWLAVAFGFGLLARTVGLPPLVGYLAAGFVLGAAYPGAAEGPLLDKLSDLGITLLLFTVGLKLNLGTLARPQVWSVAMLHMLITVAVLFAFLGGLGTLGLPLLAQQEPETQLLLAFALSFSSTVFVVKLLEERAAVTALYGRLAIGVLLMQDVAAVVFLAAASGKVPTVWSLLLLLLFPARHILGRVLAFLGHGELLILYGFVLALGGAELFESVGVKGDIGALVVGVCLAGHSRAEELSKAMLSFKDLFLLSFFLSIGLAGVPSLMAVGVAALLAPLAVAKAALFFGLFSLHRLRLRTAFQGALSLANYSEFGLIVAAVGVANGWLDAAWLVLLALSLAFSFLLSALGARYSEPVYRTLKPALRRFERQTLTTEDQLLTLDGAKVAVVGMGGVGSGAYDALAAEGKLGLVGVDLDPVTVASHTAAQRRVLRGDPTDPDFWDRIVDSHTLDLVLIALPKLSTTLDVIERLSELGYDGEIAATCRFEDEAEALRQAGASTVFNLYDDAGVAFVARAEGQLAALLPTP